jgi:hypothetical protein
VAGTPSPGVPPAPGAPPPPPMTSPALTLQFVLDRLLLPTHRSDHAIDLDGDGRLDNQFGNVFGALAAQNLDLQRGIDDALMDGSLVVLVTLATEQPVLNANQRADLTIVRGIATGGGHQIAPGAAPLTLTGQITAGRFTSHAPLIGSVAPTWTLDLPFGGGRAMPLSIEAPRISCAVSATRLSGGVLAGSVSAGAVQGDVVPALAGTLTAQIAADPTSVASRQIAALFDTGGCTNPDGSVAHAGDGVIDVCEVGSNSIIRNVLAPDLQVHDAVGGYAPVPGGTALDSLSLGLGFTAMVATF